MTASPLLVSTLLLALAAPAPSPRDAAAAIAARPDVSAALAAIEQRRDSLVEEWVRIAQIPAPSGAEGRRADYLERRFREIGLASVGRDAAGNVVGLLRGQDRSLPSVAFLAHMDTVAPAHANHTVDRSVRGRLKGPGVRDDSSGLAAMLAAAEALIRHRLLPVADTWFVATAREEVGLKGAERFVADHERELGAVVALDGQLGQISWAASGVVWLKIHFLAPGAHTLRAHESPSAIHAAARSIERISAIPLRRSPESVESWLNIGMIGGGEVPNAQAREAWFTLDIRSNDAETLQSLERQALAEVERSAAELGVTVEQETLQRQAAARLEGAESGALVRAARGALLHLGWDAIELTPRGTADHCVAVARGIPGIAIGVTTGDGAHTPEEYAEVGPYPTGVRQILLLALLPLSETGGASSR